ncbi:uncharacterized protein LOC124279308 [Haliotis rubra]|uniref:uncharacterized protein LOC124279308 n=1 Tax=Haliotis rubra TaxID=36100 RepID=UPI001EE5C8D8|nr:uncharacterized protein LOC124279308 [Haliotis rubra]
MAGTLPDQSVADSIPNAFLTCGICQETVTDPRILPCLHSVCFNCLRALGQCPQCREPISAEVDSFKNNVFIKGLTELARSKSAKSNQCTPCRLTGRSSLAEKKCLNCGDDLCSKCADGHNASTQTFGHQIVSLEDFWEGLHDDQFRRLQRIGCPHHQDKHVDYFCQSCRLPVCISCIVLLHKGHNTQPIEEAAIQIKSIMNSKVRVVREEFNLISQEEKSILSLTKSLKLKAELETSGIEDNAKREIAKIHNRKLDAINKLSTETKEREKEHNARLEELSQQKRKISSCVAFCDSILDAGKDEELLMMKTMIMDRLQQIRGCAVAVLQKDALTPAVAVLQKDALTPAVAVLQKDALTPAVAVLQKDALTPAVAVLQKDALTPDVAVLQKDALTPAVAVLQKDALTPAVAVLQKVALSPERYALTPAVAVLQKDALTPAVAVLQKDALTPAVAVLQKDALTPAVAVLQKDALTPAVAVLQKDALTPAVAVLQKVALTPAKDDVHKDKTQDSYQKSETASSVPLNKTAPPRYTIKFQGTFPTKFKGDAIKPNIKGTAYSVSAGLLISDLANGKVKMINTKGDLKEVITMDGFHPRAVAAAGEIIAVISENFLCIFTSKGNLTTKVKLNQTKPDESLPFTCSLAASEDVGIVVGNIHGVKRLRVYNFDGTVNRYLDFHVSFPLASLSVSPTGDIVISEWGSGCLRVVSTEGKARWTSREHDYWWKPNGTCVSADGTVVVADYDWGGVYVYSSSDNMAALPCQSVTDLGQDDFLSCGICHGMFTYPRILPCLHTFCLQCLCTHTESSKSSQRSLLCPRCREPFTETTFENINVFINGLTELLKCKTSTECKCTPCSLRDRVSTAEGKCLDCGDCLCRACSRGHNASSQTLEHRVVTLSDLQEGKYDSRIRELQRIVCQQHPDKHVEYFCELCSHPVCISCVLNNHRDHSMQPISEAVRRIRSEMKAELTAVRENLNKISKQENELLSLKNDLELKEKAKKLLIEEHAKREIDKVNARKYASLKRLTDEMEVAEKEQASRRQKVLQQKVVMGSCVDFCDHMLGKAKDDEVLMMEPIITERLQQLLRQIHQQDERIIENEEVHTDKSVTSVLEPETTQDDSNSLTCTRGQLESEITAKIQFKFQSKFSARIKSDLKVPDIKGIAYGLNIGLVVSDLANKKIKVFKTNGELDREIKTDIFKPFDVAAAGNIIGSISENFLIIFTSVGTLKTRTMLNKYITYESLPFTYSLAAAEHVGFVVGNSPGDRRLRLYGLDGTLTRYVNCRTRTPLASLSVTPKGDILISEWGSGSLRLLSKEGKDKWRSEKYDSRWKPNGNCVSTHGTIFVADYDWGGVCVFSTDGNNTVDYSTAGDGLLKPSYVAANENGLLFVGDQKGDVYVYQT